MLFPCDVGLKTDSYSTFSALSEILAYISGLEYAFHMAPKNMKSMVMALFLFMGAVAAAIGEAFVSAF